MVMLMLGNKCDRAMAVNIAVGWLGQSREQVEQRRLPASIRSDESDGLAGCHLQIGRSERDEIAIVNAGVLEACERSLTQTIFG